MTARSRIVTLALAVAGLLVGLAGIAGLVSPAVVGLVLLALVGTLVACLYVALDSIDQLLEENRLLRRLPPSRR